MGEVSLLPHEQDWIIANEGMWSLSKMESMSGIPAGTIENYINCIGRENCRRIRMEKGLMPVTYAEAVANGWVKPIKTYLTEIWNDHSITEIAAILNASFASVVYEGRKNKLDFSAEKEKEIKEREAISKANRFKNYLPLSRSERADCSSTRSHGYDTPMSGAKCNGLPIIKWS